MNKKQYIGRTLIMILLCIAFIAFPNIGIYFLAEHQKSIGIIFIIIGVLCGISCIVFALLSSKAMSKYEEQVLLKKLTTSTYSFKDTDLTQESIVKRLIDIGYSYETPISYTRASPNGKTTIRYNTRFIHENDVADPQQYNQLLKKHAHNTAIIFIQKNFEQNMQILREHTISVFAYNRTHLIKKPFFYPVVVYNGDIHYLDGEKFSSEAQGEAIRIFELINENSDEKTSLKIEWSDSTLTVKKSWSPLYIIGIFIMPAIFVMCAMLSLKNPEFRIFLFVFPIIFLLQLPNTLNILFSSIEINRQTRELTVKTPFKTTVKFAEIKDIITILDNTSGKSKDYCTVRIILSNNEMLKIHLFYPKQCIELAELLREQVSITV